MKSRFFRNKAYIPTVILAAMLVFTCIPAYASSDTNDIIPDKEGVTFYEPVFNEYSGVNGKPVFTLSWSEYAKDADYEIAFYAEGEDPYGRGNFAIRSTKSLYSGQTSADIYFLQGVYTDTVRYRMKVRPIIRNYNYKNAPMLWSEIWEIDFTEGEYTVNQTEEDFDEEIAAAKEAEKANRTPTPTPEIRKYEPLEHSYPELLITYLAREKGLEKISADEIASFDVTVSLGEAGPAPTQHFTDEDMVSEFKYAVENMLVVGKRDDYVILDGMGTGYSARDKEGNMLLSFYIQEGGLERSDGHMEVTGLELLPDEGVMHANDWYDYYDEYSRLSNEYAASIDPKGMNLIDAAGYGTHRMHEAGEDALYYTYIYIDWNNDVEALKTDDPGENKSIFNALTQVTVGEKNSDPKGQMWHMSFSFNDPDDPYGGSAWIGFKGDCVKIGSSYYTLENSEALYGAVECEMLEYLRDFATAPKISPVY